MRFAAVAVLVLVAAIAVAGAPAASDVLAHVHEVDAMHPSTTRVVDGKTHIEHSYHYVHPVHKTFVKKQMRGVLATHKYAFVQLDAPNVQSVTFGPENADGVSVVSLVSPSAGVLASLQSTAQSAVLVGMHVRDNQQRHVMHHVVEVVSRSVSLVVVKARAASYEDLFEDLDVDFSTNHLLQEGAREEAAHEGLVEYPDESAGLQIEAPVFAPAHRGAKAQWFGRIWRAIVKGISKVFSFSGLTNKMKSLGTSLMRSFRSLISLALTGDLSKSGSKELANFVYNRPNNEQIERVTEKWFKQLGNVKVGVSARFVATLQYAISIRSYRLQRASADLGGQMAAEIMADLTLSYSKTTESDYRKQLMYLKLTPIAFALGPIPVVIRPVFETYGGFSLEVNAQATMNVRVAGQGSVRFGLLYENGRLRPTSSRTFTFEKHITGSLKGEVLLRPYIEPVFAVEINFLGGPVANLNIASEVEFTVDTSSRSCPVGISINLVPTLTVGARLQVRAFGRTLVNKQIPPTVVYTTKAQLLRKCHSGSWNRNSFFNPSATSAYTIDSGDRASVYQGAAPGCSVQDMSLQVVGASGSSVALIGAMTTGSGGQQLSLIGTQDGNGQLTFERANVDDIDFVTTDDASLAMEKMRGAVSADGQTIVVRGFGGCSDIELRRPPTETGSFAVAGALDVNGTGSQRSLGGGVVAAIACGAAAVVIVAAALIAVYRRRRAAEASPLEASIGATDM